MNVPHTLLLADDSVTIQRVIELTFADEDIRVVAVSDGDQAIAVLDTTPPDIVLADVGMPGKNGYEVAQHIRDTPTLAHIPVLLLTGAFEPIDQAKAAEVGCDGVLAKPFEPQLVIGKVKELLARPRQPLPAPEAQTSLPVPAVIHGHVKTPAPAEVDQYFDRLDQAFASLSSGSPAERSPAETRSLADQIDWFAGAQGADEAQTQALDHWDGAPSPAFAGDLPLAAQSPVLAAQSPVSPMPPASMPVPPAPLPIAAPPPALPPMAEAFAALLAAEQSAASPSAAALWPMWPATPAILTDEVIEHAVRRVLDRLPERVIREAVADVVSGVAERLVREEIERIKASVK
jgi:CheY-like chemotaxis protein